jgi:hypothetical protein
MSAYDFSDSALSKVLVVLIESGLMYTTSILILFALYMAGHNGQYGVSNAVSEKEASSLVLSGSFWCIQG